jgi:hypothetical protein
MATAKTETIKIQIDDLVREATAEEIALIQSGRAEALAAAEAQTTARASALAKLAELGLTEDEIAAL